MADTSSVDLEKLEALLNGGVDAESALRSCSDDITDEQGLEALAELGDHLDCLACSEKLADALANVKEALALIDRLPRRTARELRDVKTSLKDALKEAGLDE